MQQISYSIALILMMSIKGVFVTQDNLGHMYIVNDHQSLIQTNDSGQMLHSYHNFIYGVPSSVDASNPQKIICFNKDLHTLTYLSSDLTLLGHVQLADKGFGNTLAACSSFDSNVWLFDGESNSLKKVDANFNVLQNSSDFTALVGMRLNPYRIIERNNRVVICDSLNGIFVMDIFGLLQKNVHRTGISWCDTDGRHLYYIAGKLLMIYDMDNREESNIELDVDKPGMFSLLKNRIVVLSPDNISVLSIKSGLNK